MQVLTKETTFDEKDDVWICRHCDSVNDGTAGKTSVAASEMASSAPQAPDLTAPVHAPTPSKVAVGQADATKLLLLMDADKNGKVSRAEFMATMARSLTGWIRITTANWMLRNLNNHNWRCRTAVSPIDKPRPNERRVSRGGMTVSASPRLTRI